MKPGFSPTEPTARHAVIVVECGAQVAGLPVDDVSDIFTARMDRRAARDGQPASILFIQAPRSSVRAIQTAVNSATQTEPERARPIAAPKVWGATVRICAASPCELTAPPSRDALHITQIYCI